MIICSFCITFYNQEKFVVDSLNSILTMDLPFDYEILIGDDGSDDKTTDIINEYVAANPNKIKLFIMPRDKNVKYDLVERASANRLNLVAKSCGKYISFIDGDDFYCDNNFVKNAISILEKDNSLVACTGKYKTVYEDGTEAFINNDLRFGVVKPETYIENTYIHVGCSIFRNIWQSSSIYDPSLEGIFDDNSITLYLLQYGNMYYIDNIVYAYRQVSSSIWNNTSIIERNIINALDYKILSNLLPKFEQSILIRQFKAMQYVYNNKKKIRYLLGKEKYDKYMLLAKNDCLINICINYLNSSIIQKIKLFIVYHRLKKRVENAKIFRS